MELITVGSTQAMRGKQILHDQGIRATVSKRSGKDGCYYILSVSEKYGIAARRILQNTGVLK